MLSGSSVNSATFSAHTVEHIFGRYERHHFGIFYFVKVDMVLRLPYLSIIYLGAESVVLAL